FSALSLVALLTLPMGPLADFILGASLGFGFWVRPNILLLVFPIVLWIMIRREWPRLIRSLLVLALFLLINILVNIHLFGSPQPYGHGTPPLGDTLSNAVERGLRHLFRLHDQQAEIGILLVTLGLLFGRLSRNLRVFLGGIFIIFLIFFACYRWEDAWWYFRFLLPAFPAIALLETSFLVQLMAAVAWKRSGNFFLVVFFSVFTLASIQFSRDQFVFTNPHSEIKHPLAAEMALRHVKQPALIYAMLYSGSLRFYGKLATSRYDLGSPAGMLKEIRDIQKAGGRVYLLLDHGELKKMIETENRMLLNYSRLIDSLDHPEQIELYELNVPLMKDNLL
ncbi:MAG TPA: hypothetical protein VK564_11490, partial [Thermodesulfobacteriota bacterium]|nr:hypothetical protein [Thermodesulfobacteriota bacterium]